MAADCTCPSITTPAPECPRHGVDACDAAAAAGERIPSPATELDIAVSAPDDEHLTIAVTIPLNEHAQGMLVQTFTRSTIETIRVGHAEEMERRGGA